MTQRLSLSINLGLAALLAWALLGQGPAAGGGVARVLTFAAPAFTPGNETSHNDSTDPVCGAQVPNSAAPDGNSENQGDLNAELGSFLETVQLPQGAEVTRLTMFANDNSGEDAHVYLVRKRIEGRLAPQFRGYRVMATASTQGAENNVMRRFGDNSIRSARIDNEHYSYYLEMVVCDFIEPFAVQVAYRP
jgi:hypothetical protein